MTSHVFLLHGAWGLPAQMRPLAHVLETHGHGTTCLPLKWPSRQQAIELAAGDLARAVTQCNATTIHLVGFSMGAVICRYFLQRLGGHARVSRFVSLAGPHAGTKTASLLPVYLTGQLRPGSSLLADLNRDADPWQGTRVAAFYSPWDPIIRPATSARLPSAEREATFRVFPHSALLMHRPALDATARFLSEPVDDPCAVTDQNGAPCAAVAAAAAPIHGLSPS